MKIIEFIKNLINTILDGSLERVKILSAMNQNFKDSFCSGGLDRLCKVSIACGNPEFAHEMSSMWLKMIME